MEKVGTEQRGVREGKETRAPVHWEAVRRALSLLVSDLAGPRCPQDKLVSGPWPPLGPSQTAPAPLPSRPSSVLTGPVSPWPPGLRPGCALYLEPPSPSSGPCSPCRSKQRLRPCLPQEAHPDSPSKGRWDEHKKSELEGPLASRVVHSSTPASHDGGQKRLRGLDGAAAAAVWPSHQPPDLLISQEKPAIWCITRSFPNFTCWQLI